MPITDAERAAALRHLPAVDRLLQLPALAAVPRGLLLREVRAFVTEARERIDRGDLDAAATAAMFAAEAVVAAIRRRCAVAGEPRHRRVYNATGIVLHTGIGRAPMCAAAAAALQDAAGYAVVEVDPQTGLRDQRELGVGAVLRALTGAEGALVVNNNAAATTLMLTALCAGREVVISRGELVEIGGGFRVPDVMRRAGCDMVEIGATNKTHLRDFEAAVTERTRALLKVHPSNFRIEGFASVPTVAELRPLASARGLLLLDDLGSGLLLDRSLPGLTDEPSVAQSLAAGADVVCFSGDKLLGGPQCGILLGRGDLIAAIRAHPLYRALRCDKLALAALEATLLVYRDGEPLRDIPALAMLSAGSELLRQRSEELAVRLGAPSAEIVASESFAGSGANPARPLPSWSVALAGGDALCLRLRAVRPIAVFARQSDGNVLLDARTLLGEDLAAVAAAVKAAMQRP